MADAGAASPRFYRPELDALRFIAFFAVYLHHSIAREGRWVDPAWGFQGQEVIAGIGNAGAFGLCLFFFLSGYLITELLQRERDLTGELSPRRFWIRRILRIWPLYSLGLACGLASQFWRQEPLDDGRFLAYAVMLGNWYCVRFGWSPNPMTHLWTISIEEQFYLLWPLLMLLPRRLLVRIPLLFVAISGVALTYLGISHAALDTAVWANSFVQFAFLGGGAAVALWRADEWPPLPAWARWPAVALALAAWFIAAYALRIKYIAPADGPVGLVVGFALVLAGCGALFFALLGTNVPRWAAWLGRISYGLYVYHWMAVGVVDDVAPSLRASHATLDGVARAAIGLAITVVVASMSYYGLERPFLRLKDRFARIATRPA